MKKRSLVLFILFMVCVLPGVFGAQGEKISAQAQMEQAVADIKMRARKVLEENLSLSREGEIMQAKRDKLQAASVLLKKQMRDDEKSIRHDQKMTLLIDEKMVKAKKSFSDRAKCLDVVNINITLLTKQIADLQLEKQALSEELARLQAQNQSMRTYRRAQEKKSFSTEDDLLIKEISALIQDTQLMRADDRRHQEKLAQSKKAIHLLGQARFEDKDRTEKMLLSLSKVLRVDHRDEQMPVGRKALALIDKEKKYLDEKKSAINELSAALNDFSLYVGREAGSTDVTRNVVGAYYEAVKNKVGLLIDVAQELKKQQGFFADELKAFVRQVEGVVNDADQALTRNQGLKKEISALRSTIPKEQGQEGAAVIAAVDPWLQKAQRQEEALIREVQELTAQKEKHAQALAAAVAEKQNKTLVVEKDLEDKIAKAQQKNKELQDQIVELNAKILKAQEAQDVQQIKEAQEAQKAKEVQEAERSLKEQAQKAKEVQEAEKKLKEQGQEEIPAPKPAVKAPHPPADENVVPARALWKLPQILREDQ